MVRTMNYDQQYTFAKNQAINAITSGHNIVLYGSGANGKTYLIHELETILNENDYQPMPEPAFGCELHDQTSNILEDCKKTRWIIAINNIDHIQSSLKYNSFVFINMNNFEYPLYSKMRSGKTVA